MTENLLFEDLDNILAQAEPALQSFKHGNIFITGGTGFFGTWILESLCWANTKLNLQLRINVLTRNEKQFQSKAPHLAATPFVRFQHGDIRNFEFPKEKFDFIIHGATQASALLNESRPDEMLQTMVQGTERILKFANQTQCRELLLLSSGAIYGQQPSEMTHLPETYMGGPNPLDPLAAYAEGKRTSELLASIAHKHNALSVKIARCFTFVGPHLPLDAHFAIGNFIGDGLRNCPLKIGGDGTPYRSYMYMSDLIVWLFAILMKGQANRAYNVGSEDDRSIKEVAEAVSKHFQPKLEISIAKEPNPDLRPPRYVPSTERARTELGLKETVSLDESIAKTITWHKKSTIS
ncbi:MAG TPA: NAD-dependent epimerase/dehydratase family protein [Oculatellaceae cyanobacterium]